MMSSNEVVTLINALGTGSKDFNIENLRYDKIIIMTDADVDGSHIRTLLLTFFFRQMRELIERGHIFIAQPPLYKIAKGKQHSYLKDEEALDQYLTQSALENTELFVNPEAPAISGAALEELVAEYRGVMATIARLSRLYPEAVLTELLGHSVLQVGDLQAESEVSGWIQGLQERFDAMEGSGPTYRCIVRKDLERNYYFPGLVRTSHGVDTDYELHRDFFTSGEYREICAVGQKISYLIESGGYIKRGERQSEVDDFPAVLDWLMAEAKRGHYIQRYKGLGEMNPDQLWETTMDPEGRRMLQVTIEDAIAADQIFTTLMGDQVEPRREFIEKNALAVGNLDI
jgi:DNA gyrase subunit B